MNNNSDVLCVFLLHLYMASLLNNFSSLLARSVFAKLSLPNAGREHAILAQQKIFQTLCSRAATTSFARHFSIDESETPERFACDVPVFHYDEIKPYILKQRAGEPDVLWPGVVNRYAKSSGTTADVSKFIPITKESLYKNHFKAGKDLLNYYYHAFPQSNLLKGYDLAVGGTFSHDIQERPAVITGDLSAHLIKELPWWIRWHRVPDLKTMLDTNWERKFSSIAEKAAKKNITAVLGVPSWVVMVLNRVLDVSGKKTIPDVWPDFEAYFHGGVALVPYREQINRLMGGKEVHYWENYNASEGFFAVNDLAGEDSMLLMSDHGIYYEFIDFADYQEEKFNSVPLEGVKDGIPYVMIISTMAGLWRYVVGDVVEFTSVDPFRIKILGRTAQFLNIAGEELMLHTIENAVAAVCKEFSCTMGEYTIGPAIPDEVGVYAHHWLTEFIIPPVDVKSFSEKLDQTLQRLNSDYAAKRFNNSVLRPLQLTVLKNGTFYRWLTDKNKLGGQNKVPRMRGDRKIIVEILNTEIK